MPGPTFFGGRGNTKQVKPRPFPECFARVKLGLKFDARHISDPHLLNFGITFMELSLQAPALLFPAISLLLLAYTNRYLHLSQLIRKLHADYKTAADPLIIAQIGNLRHRVALIKTMQTLGVSSILGCTLSMFALFAGWQAGGKAVFGFSLILMMGSLLFSLREIGLSGDALNLQLSDLEEISHK